MGILCSTFIHLLYTTSIPFSFAFLSASLLYIPDCIQITLIPFFFIASPTTGGTSSDLLNTSTTSTCSGISETLAYDFLPSTSFVVGFTGITLYPFSIRYFGTKLAGFPSVFDIPTTATFFSLPRNYIPHTAKIQKGDTIRWSNTDSKPHHLKCAMHIGQVLFGYWYSPLRSQ